MTCIVDKRWDHNRRRGYEIEIGEVVEALRRYGRSRGLEKLFETAFQQLRPYSLWQASDVPEAKGSMLASLTALSLAATLSVISASLDACST